MTSTTVALTCAITVDQHGTVAWTLRAQREPGCRDLTESPAVELIELLLLPQTSRREQQLESQF